MSNKLLYILLIIIFLCSGCPKEPQSKYQEKDFVIHRLSGLKGQVMKVVYSCTEYTYKVRFYTKSARTNVSLFGSDGAIESLPLVMLWVKEYEIKHWQVD